MRELIEDETCCGIKELLGYKYYNSDLQVFKVLNLLSLKGHQGISPLCPFFYYAFSAQGQFLPLPLSAFLPCTRSEIQSFQWRTTSSVVSSSSLVVLSSLPEVIPPHHLLTYCLWPTLLSKKKQSPLELSSDQFRKTLPALVESRTLPVVTRFVAVLLDLFIFLLQFLPFVGALFSCNFY